MKIWMIGKYSMKLHYLEKNLNMEGIIVADYTHPKKVGKDYKRNNLGEYMFHMFKLIHSCLLMYLRTFHICVLKYMKPTLLIFLLNLD